MIARPGYADLESIRISQILKTYKISVFPVAINDFPNPGERQNPTLFVP